MCVTVLQCDFPKPIVLSVQRTVMSALCLYIFIIVVRSMNQYNFIAMYLLHLHVNAVFGDVYQHIVELWFGVFNDVLSGSGTMHDCCVMHSLHMVCAPWYVMWD